MSAQSKLRILCSILFVFPVSFAAGASKPAPQVHSWGRSELAVRPDGSTVVSVLLDPTRMECPGGIVPPKTFFFALRPGQKVDAAVLSYQTTAVPAGWVTAPIRYTNSTDSSMLAPIKQTGADEKFISRLPQRPDVRVAGYGWYRNYYVARIEISPYLSAPQGNSILLSSRIEVGIRQLASTPFSAQPKIKRDPEFESILRDLIVNYDDAQPYRIAVWNDTTAGWFNTASNYAKLGIGADGIYRLRYRDMNLLFPILGQLSTIQVFHNGKEVPVFVRDANGNDAFDSTDYVEFPARRNYTDSQRQVVAGTDEYHEFLNRYTDTSYYWITFGNSTGLRSPLNPNTVSAETLRSYTAFIHLEENGAPGLQFCGPIDSAQDPRYSAGDFWPWQFMDFKDARRTITQNFTASDVDSSADSLTVYSKFMNWGADLLPDTTIVSNVGIRLNDATDLASVALRKFGQAVLRGRAPVSKLVNGSNAVSIAMKQTVSALDVCVYDWFEMEYPRKLKAVNDSLIFDFRTITGRKLRTVQVSNLTSQNVALYKVQPVVERVVNVTYSLTAPYTLTFSDTIGPNEEYFLAGDSKILTPVMRLPAKQFAGLRTNKQQTDYLIITHSKFKPEAEQYRQYIATTRLLTARTIDVQDIFDEFGYGYPTPESMQQYLRSTMQFDGAPPSYLFLIGDASYDYKFYDGNYDAINYVPSYGYPVSDAMLSVWDDGGYQPQMYTGRLPVNNLGEVSQYLSRVKTYNTFPNDDWNKRYLFFTGGDPETQGQVELLKATQDSVLHVYVQPAPIGGLATHFYKTSNPHTDFGPYTTQQIRDAISAGALFYSYVGHSGTETWDNSIGDPSQLQNDRGRFGLITDMGCSTGKFAEPQIKAFSELFVVGPSSSAIAYIGNSSLGFVATAQALPIYFYSRILHDSVRTIGKAHLQAKLSFASTGLSLLNRVMLYTGTLIGDPSLDLAVPFTPNLVESPSLISSQDPSPTDQADSTAVNVVIANFGSVTKDSVDVRIDHSFGGTILRSVTVRRPMPLLYDTLRIFIGTKTRSGEHRVTATVDPQNKITEISKQDNSATASIFVASSDFSIVQPLPSSISTSSRIVLLNPTILPKGSAQTVLLQIATVKSFASADSFTSPMGAVTTSFAIDTLPKPKRYWWRANTAQSTHEWTTGTFFLGTSSESSFGQIDSVGWSEDAFSNTEFGSEGVARLQRAPLAIQAISSGAKDGSFGAVTLNSINVLPNSYSTGHSVVELDPVTYRVLNVQNFNTYVDPGQVTALANYIDTIPPGHIVIAVIIDEGRNNLNASLAARNAYKSIGSKLIDSLQQQWDSWAIIGRKGAPVGSVPEMLRHPFSGRAIVDTTFSKIESQGSIVTPLVGPVGSWKQLSLSITKPPGSLLTTSVVGAKVDGTVDTVASSSLDSVINLATISSKQYPKLRLKFSYTANPQLQSPGISRWSLSQTPPVELATSPQVLSLSKSTLQEGEYDTVKVKVFNVGGSTADSVESVLSSNDTGPYRVVQAFPPFTLSGGDSISLKAVYDTKGRRGSHSFLFQIDPQNKLSDQFISNNSVTVPYIVLSDTIRPSIDLTFDNAHVLDGDYVRAVPLVVLQLRDPNGIPISQNDTSNVYIELDGRQVYYGGSSTIQFSVGAAPVLAEVRWTPRLSEGEHALRYYAKDAAGNSSDTSLIYVNVASKLEIFDVYNIPNPFGHGTTFTFTLAGTDDPQSAHIKIYTVAGRLIQDLDLSSKVHIGANGYKNSSDNLFWDGRDRDGSEIANGVYFYRVIINGNGQQTTATQKLVKMR